MLDRINRPILQCTDEAIVVGFKQADETDMQRILLHTRRRRSHVRREHELVESQQRQRKVASILISSII